MPTPYPLQGGCDCGFIRYRLNCKPLIVHCCHCSWCQRETGSAFAVNAMVESEQVELLQGEPELINTPSASGQGQQIARCPKCHVALWSHYAGSGPLTKFVRVGTLDQPQVLPPDVHIFTSTKQPWVILPEHIPAFAEYYDRQLVWSADSLQRAEVLMPKLKAYRQSLKPA
ncbi:GFA family protein [Shewanella fodinae]|uniref:GFA family protein n=1 Tax=Shewanella fodinae TaxID=552357 RepID=UPI00167798C9|nr:GFA family protein [Shewanella fodinae]MCL2906999.1 GFA family protein [Shewanella fodinae]